MKTESVASISFEGFLTLQDDIQYSCTEEGELHFELGEATQKMLRRTRTTLKRVEYDATEDVAVVHVRPPVIPSVVFRMKRVGGKEEEETGSGEDKEENGDEGNALLDDVVHTPRA